MQQKFLLLAELANEFDQKPVLDPIFCRVKVTIGRIRAREIYVTNLTLSFSKDVAKSRENGGENGSMPGNPT